MRDRATGRECGIRTYRTVCKAYLGARSNGWAVICRPSYLVSHFAPEASCTRGDTRREPGKDSVRVREETSEKKKVRDALA